MGEFGNRKNVLPYEEQPRLGEVVHQRLDCLLTVICGSSQVTACAMYAWRSMSGKARTELLEWRKSRKHPWHSPPHWKSDRTNRYLFTAACFEHAPIIGCSARRMAEFEENLLLVFKGGSSEMHAWAVLPNHYHVLASTDDPLALLRKLGQLHGKTAFQWNGEENQRGRQVWCRAAETAMKSEGHFWATVNYVHHNPVKHGWVKRWQDWPFSSAEQYLECCGRDTAAKMWEEFPIGDYGKGWDD